MRRLLGFNALSAVVLGIGFVGRLPREDRARVIASAQGLTIESVSCSPRGEVAWTCTGRLQSGREFTCSVGPVGRVNAVGTCTARADRP